MTTNIEGSTFHSPKLKWCFFRICFVRVLISNNVTLLNLRLPHILHVLAIVDSLVELKDLPERTKS